MINNSHFFTVGILSALTDSGRALRLRHDVRNCSVESAKVTSARRVGWRCGRNSILDWGHDDVARLYEDIAEGAISRRRISVGIPGRIAASLQIFGRCTASTTGNPSR